MPQSRVRTAGRHLFLSVLALVHASNLLHRVMGWAQSCVGGQLWKSSAGIRGRERLGLREAEARERLVCTRVLEM